MGRLLHRRHSSLCKAGLELLVEGRAGSYSLGTMGRQAQMGCRCRARRCEAEIASGRLVFVFVCLFFCLAFCLRDWVRRLEWM